MELTLEELERSLPNGLHDAELLALRVDYARREAAVDVNVDVGRPEAADQHEEAYRLACIVFSAIQFVVVDPPAVNDGYVGISLMDAGTGPPRTAPCDLPPFPEDCFLCWLFVSRWNSFIRIAARSVALEWIDQTHAS